MIQIISLGGSAAFGKRKNKMFLKRFSKIIKKSKDKYHIVVGGGEIARQYQRLGKKLGFNHNELDRVGIAATKLNAEVLKQLFKTKKVIETPLEPGKEKINIYSGWKPGFSTDYVSTVLAKTLGQKRIINITDVGYLYTKEPSKRGAKKIGRISKEQVIEYFRKKWVPGLKFPIDPFALKDSRGIDIHIVGKNIDNLKKCLKNKKFNGTIVHD